MTTLISAKEMSEITAEYRIANKTKILREINERMKKEAKSGKYYCYIFVEDGLKDLVINSLKSAGYNIEKQVYGKCIKVSWEHERR